LLIVKPAEFRIVHC